MIVDIEITSLYALLGIIIMIIGSMIIDWCIPGDFPTEIKRGNRAVGWLCAGIFIGLGYIIRAAIVSPAIPFMEEALWHGIKSSIIYSALGIIFFLIGYYLLHICHRAYSLTEEIMNGNTAAGIMLFGSFVGMALIISGAIH